uniref:Ribosomal protein L16 n=1 Tax=Spumella sp. NIES-1846 TaxID=2490549 RepID=A0A455RHZ3_9STRA|nr:ribosomal protein L16 [Spumella sp. NIES-1846]
MPTHTTLVKKHLASLHGYEKIALGYSQANNCFPQSLYAVESLDRFYISKKMLEYLTALFKKNLKKFATVYCMVHPYLAVTARAKEARMGSGKGSICNWVMPVKPHRILWTIKTIIKDLQLFSIVKKLIKTIKYKLVAKLNLLCHI